METELNVTIQSFQIKTQRINDILNITFKWIHFKIILK